MEKEHGPIQHRCPVCLAAIATSLKEPPAVCPACGNVILHCGVCGGLLYRPPIAYCGKCKRPVCLNCRVSDDLTWRSLKWWAVCWKCGGQGR